MTQRAPIRFPIRFDAWYRVLSSIVLIPPAACFLEVTDDELVVQMAWAFRARMPRTAIESVAPFAERPVSRGVHGWAGQWLVNGSADGLVKLDLAPGRSASVLGVSVRLRELLVSVESAASFIERLQPVPRAAQRAG